MKKVAVVGAGIAGLACAYELQKAGFEVEVFEHNQTVGGRMASREKDGLLFDIGANFLVSNYKQAHAYCKELGIEDKWQPMVEGDPFVFANEKLHRMTAKPGKMLLEMTALPLLSRLRLLRMLWKVKNDIQHLEFYNLTESVAYDTDNAYDYTVKHADQKVADYVIDPFTATYQFHSAKEISLAGMLALIGAMFGNPEEFQMHHTIGEMSALPDAFASKLTVHLASPVTAVEARDKGVLVRVNGSDKEYDAVVLACPATTTRTLYTNATQRQQEFIESVRYASTINVSFKIPVNSLIDTSVVMVPFKESQLISEYTNEQTKGQIANGKTLVNIGLHEEEAKRLMQLNDEEVFEIVKKELLRVCPPLQDKAAEVTPHDLQRWPQAMPKFAHGHLTNVKEFLNNGQGDQNVFLCADYMNSPWTEGSMRCGKRVAKDITQRVK